MWQKNFSITLCLLILLIAATGCGASFKSPVEMIKKPKMVASQQIAKEVIDANIPVGSKLVRPLESNNLSSVGMIDWNGDGLNEVYAFYKNAESLEAGVMILSQNQEKWTVKALVEDVGVDIAFAEFVDFNDDHILDVVLGLTAKDDTFKSLVVFEWQADGSYKLIFKDVYTEIRIQDVNQDAKNEMLVLKLDRNQFASAAIHRYQEGTLVKIDEVQMDSFISGYYGIQFGQVAKDQFGFILDFKIGSKSATNILLFNDDRLSLVFDVFESDNRYDQTIKDAPILSADINEDGVVEIGNRLLPYNYDEWSNDPPYLNTWFQWDGKSGLDLVRMNYLDETIGYRFDFPQRWIDAAYQGQLTVIKSRRFMNRQFLDVYLSPKEAVLYKIFSLEIMDKNSYEVVQSQNNEFVMLSENETMVFVGKNMGLETVAPEHIERCQNMLLSQEEMYTLFGFVK